MLARVRLIDDTQTYLTLAVKLTDELFGPALNIEPPLDLHVELSLPLALDVLADGTQWLAEVVLVPVKFVSLNSIGEDRDVPLHDDVELAVLVGELQDELILLIIGRVSGKWWSRRERRLERQDLRLLRL